MTQPRLEESELAAIEREATLLETPLGAQQGKLVWRRWGTGPAVVLLHGSAGSWRHWVRCIRPLAQSRTVYAPDLPGMGDSDEMAEPVTLQAIGRAVTDGIARLLAPAERFDLVGFSFGTGVAGQVALHCGDAVRTLTLIAPGALGLPKTTAKLQNWRLAPDEQAARAIHRQNLASLMIADPALIDETAVTIQQHNATLARLKSRPLTPPDALLPVFERIDPAVIYAIVGERDVVAAAHMEERRRFFAQRLPEGHFKIIAGAGHWVAYEAPAALMDALSPILAG